MPSETRIRNDAILKKWCASITGDVLSVGSSNDLDGESKNYSDYFKHAQSYTTSEIIPGCDLLLDIRSMIEIKDNSYDCIFCSQVLEHVDNVQKAVSECYRVLKLGGILIVGVPFNFPIHHAPFDYWRFTEYGLRYLLKNFQIKSLEAIGDDPKAPWAYLVYARKEK